MTDYIIEHHDEDQLLEIGPEPETPEEPKDAKPKRHTVHWKMTDSQASAWGEQVTNSKWER